MAAPQQSCPRCHLYLSARGCTPERCANPEGAAELERLTREEALAGPGVTKGRVLPPNDLADFCSLLGRMGCSYERGKTRTGWYVRTDEGYFFFHAAIGRFRTNGIDPAERAEFDKWIARREADLPVTAVVRKQGPQSDLDTFRAMLERAGVGHDIARAEEGTAFLFPMALMDVAHRFVFSTDGKLLRVDDQEINLPDGDE